MGTSLTFEIMPRVFGGSPKCAVCGKSAYPMESVQVDGKQLHKACFRCACDPKCTRKLSTTGYSAMDGKYFHTNCYKKIFKTRGKYEAGGALSPEEAWRAKRKGTPAAHPPLRLPPPPPPPPLLPS